jgi:hypothetical protein
MLQSNKHIVDEQRHTFIFNDKTLLTMLTKNGRAEKKLSHRAYT